MRVICISPGNQKSPNPVIVGNFYTVTDYSYGWELFHPRSSDIFYQLEEMPEEQRYWSGMFAEVDEIAEKTETLKVKQGVELL